jgi:hypothetical protein
MYLLPDLDTQKLIRKLTMRVELDDDSSWLRQDKIKSSTLYALVHVISVTPELPVYLIWRLDLNSQGRSIVQVFQNKRTAEWLAEVKFNNHRNY